MKKIRNYNPNLGFTLNELELISTLEPDSIAALFNAIRQTVYSGDVAYEPFLTKMEEKIVYNTLSGKILEQVDNYDGYLIDRCGFSKVDIEDFHNCFKHKKMMEEANKFEKEYGYLTRDLCRKAG